MSPSLINRTEFQQRRQQLMAQMAPGSMAIMPTAPEYPRNANIFYPYRPDSNFYYLTGFPEPQAIAVIIPQREQGQYILFCREKNYQQEQWEGAYIGLEGACEDYQADDAFPITDIDDIMPALMESCQHLYYPIGYYPNFDEQITDWLNQLRQRIDQGVMVPKEITSLDYILHEMRLHKTPAEINTIRAAIALTIAAQQRAIRMTQPGLYEYQLEAEIIHEFISHGCRSPAFPCIIASGKNIGTFHYTQQKDLINDNELVLIDIGAEIDYYASDITRTIPSNGHFTKPQQQLYELVLAAQQAALEKLHPGNHWNQPYQAAIEVITQGLKDLGILVGKFNALLEEEAYKRFMMPGIGHWLGMDVHEGAEYKIDEKWREFSPGMVMTVEPGLFIPAAPDIADEWWNIGVRIEDNVLITPTGHELLTAQLPRTVAEIEAFMANKNLNQDLRD